MDPAKLHLELSLFAQRRLRPTLPDAPRSDDARLRALEADFLEAERTAVAADAAHAPDEAQAFVEWFESLRQTGPGQGDPLFPWLAERATTARASWLLRPRCSWRSGRSVLWCSRY